MFRGSESGSKVWKKQGNIHLIPALTEIYNLYKLLFLSFVLPLPLKPVRKTNRYLSKHNTISSSLCMSVALVMIEDNTEESKLQSRCAGRGSSSSLGGASTIWGSSGFTNSSIEVPSLAK